MLLKNIFRIMVELSKVRITISVALTTLAGYVLVRGAFGLDVVFPVLGIFFLASASAAMNHFQDADRDGMMSRTHLRPIPSGRIGKKQVLVVVLVLVLIGTFLLALHPGTKGVALGWLALFWYNALYTPMKRITAFAVIPGSIIGSIPPMVGWVAGGGSLSDPRLILVAFFFFVWQVPHFWLLMLFYGKEYIQAGYPSITEIYTPIKLRQMIFLWSAATAIGAILLTLSGLLSSGWTKGMIIAAALWLAIVFTGLIVRRRSIQQFNPFYYFMRMNYFVLFVVLAILIDPLLK
ncbi:UbiA family prenyltransferase [Bacteroidales bacterium]